MSENFNISPRIIPSIATLYTDTNRIFMEYIDNSIDSAEEYLSSDGTYYEKEINIIVKIENNTIIFQDNCTGIKNFKKIVTNVGNSDKKAQPWTNGQFGFGIYSYLAACKEITIISKQAEDTKGTKVSLNKRIFDEDSPKDMKLPDFEKVDFGNDSGTKIILSQFEKGRFKEVDFDSLKVEIERHFEVLLRRKNLNIILIDKKYKEHKCEAYDYDSVEGEEYIDVLDNFHSTREEKGQQYLNTGYERPISVFLKVSKGKSLNRPPIFVSKGRRIAEIKDVKKFLSKHKNDVWSHPSLTGYIDVGDYLKPTIARNEFENDDNAKALFNSIKNEIEPKIIDLIKSVNKERDTKHYNNLEEEINKIFSRVSKLDKLQYKASIVSGNEISLEAGGVLQDCESGFGSKDFFDDDINDDLGDPLGGLFGDGFGPNGEDGNSMNSGDGKDENLASNKENENPLEDTQFKGEKKKNSGLSIKFVDGVPKVDEYGNSIQSELIDGTVIIYTFHPNFVDREDGKLGRLKVSSRQIAYIASEMTLHHKDKVFTKDKTPQYEKVLLKESMQFMQKFEEALSVLVGKNLSDIK